MKQLRKLIFWLHLIAGTLGGIVILIMSATGVLLVYERQITTWFDRSQYVVSPVPELKHLPVGALLGKVLKAEHGASLRLSHCVPILPNELALNFGRDRVLFVNPYTGATLGARIAKV